MSRCIAGARAICVVGPLGGPAVQAQPHVEYTASTMGTRADAEANSDLKMEAFIKICAFQKS